MYCAKLTACPWPPAVPSVMVDSISGAASASLPDRQVSHKAANGGSRVLGGVSPRPAVASGEPIDRGGPDHVGQHVREQVPGHRLAVAPGVVGGPAGRYHGG